MALFEMVYHLLKTIHRGREVPMPSYEDPPPPFLA
jgi:hypothetical protein